MNFQTPRAVIWQKVDGDISQGLLTNNLEMVPENQRPTTSSVSKRGYKRLFCLQRGYWVSLYTANILAIA